MAHDPDAPSEEPAREKVTLRTLEDMKARGEPVSWLTAYDYPTALLMDRAGVDMILVGDSAGMTMLGLETTLPVTMDQMVTFTAAVCRAVRYAFVVGDMPYMSYQASTEDAIRNAGRFMAECGADAVKIEGGTRMAPTIAAITDAGIPVLAHIGLTPQSYTQQGGFRAQGRTEASSRALIEDARVLEEAGACAILLECIPEEVAGVIARRAAIPAYGIGSGRLVDGQLMIVHDMLGLFERFTPKFVKRYASVGATFLEAFTQYRADVKEGAFPQPEHTYSMMQGESEKLREAFGEPMPAR
jgi:3-methyl-2-oxobutanoate hydroxymethyltransferase